jgi:PTS system nitrogen regulatory IIA component
LKLTSVVSCDAIIEDLAATQKEEVLKEMVGVLVEKGRLPKSLASSVVKMLMSREELGSTGIGKGVAVPHAKHDGIEGLVGAFARSKAGVEFAALDGQPVHLIFLLLSSKESSGQHLEALAKVARLVRDDRFCRFLREARDAKELAELLEEADSGLDGGAR